MNKLQGFYALERSHLPSVPWKRYEEGATFDSKILWTIRSAIKEGDDMFLPRKLGVYASEAKDYAQYLYNNMNKDDMIIYYPYFIALKSGMIEISANRTVIEAVKYDLWNLAIDNKRDVSIIIEDGDIRYIGEEHFLTRDELLELMKYCATIKKQLHKEVAAGESIFLEWSYACNSDMNKRPIGDSNLVFYEIRTV